MQTLDVVIGIVIYFLFMSLVASALVEMISAIRRKRGQVLRAAVDAATNGGDDFNNALYLHPLVYGLYESEKVGASQAKSLPSYIPSEIFAQAYVETVLGMPIEEVGDLGMVFSAEARIWPDAREVPDAPKAAKRPNPWISLRRFVESKLPDWVPEKEFVAPTATLDAPIKIQASDLKHAYRALRTHIIAAGGDRQETLKRVAKHFDQVNDRVKGRYRRWVSYWLFFIGLVLAGGTNGDATRVVNRLVSNPDLRAALVQSAELSVATVDHSREATIDRIRVIEGITGGWQSDPILAPETRTSWTVLLKALGFIITAFAVSLGAPFWFDLLKKLVALRKVVSGKEDDADEKNPMPRPTTVGELGTTLTAINTGQPWGGLLLPPESISQLSVLAGCAQQCYAAPLEFERLVKENLGVETKVTCISRQALVPFDDLTDNDPNDTDLIPVDTQVFVIRTAAQVVVACRGTEPKVLHDIATDARFKPAKVNWSPKPTEIRAHRGFVAALEVVWEELVSKIDEASGDAKLPVYFAGHSLGGAVAVLAATRFLAGAAKGNGDRFGGLHTFGQPRVGNAAFADWATSLFQGRYTRAINHRDIVPQLPPPKLGDWEFKHFGIAHVFDAAGRLAINPSWFFRLADYALPDAELKAMFKQPVQNHDSYRYASLYAALANKSPTAA